MDHEHITTDRGLAKLCASLADVESIAFDTEFVSEHSYRPELCLIQVAAGDRLAVIDPQPLKSVRPFWEALAAPGHQTIVHAGREELLFCLGEVGQPPHDLFDVQIAAGLVGYEYPAGYGSLLAKLVGKRLEKGETRTDWRRRPLTAGQIDYALDDVRYLDEMAFRLRRRLSEMNRTGWMESEMSSWMSDVRATRAGERWRKVSGTSNLSKRSLAVVREIWRWRESEAERRNCPTRRVLRDDLIVELAKRRSSDPAQIRALRGMERGDLKRCLPELAAAVGRAMALADVECPDTPPREAQPQSSVLGQFLTSALGSICRTAEVSAQHRGHGQRRARAGGVSPGVGRGQHWPRAARVGSRLARRSRGPGDRRPARRQSIRPHQRPSLRRSAVV